MVCVPCVFIPILLLIWRFLIQPIVLKLWKYRVHRSNSENDKAPPELVKKCDNGVCSMAWEKPQTSKIE